MAMLPAEAGQSSVARERMAPENHQAQNRVVVNCARLSRPAHAPDSALRDFDAEVELSGTPGTARSVIGRISGRMGWMAWLPELVDARPEDGMFPTISTAIQVGNHLSGALDAPLEAVLIVEQVWLEPPWRGHALGRRIAEQLIDLLLLAPETTLVLGVAEPQLGPTGAVVDPEAMPRRQSLSRDFEDAGFERWQDGPNWFLPPGGQDRSLDTAS
jgi:hypothetical protein